MIFGIITAVLSIGSLNVQQPDVIAGTIYFSPLPGRPAVTSQQVIAPRLGEMLIVGSARTPATLIQLVGYYGSWKSGDFSGPLGLYGEYQTSIERLVTIGSYTFLKGECFGGKLAGPQYLGFKLAGGSLEYNAPHSRLIWSVSKSVGAGLGWAINARSGKLTTLQIGPVVEWKHGTMTARVRLGQFVTGATIGAKQVRMELFHRF